MRVLLAFDKFKGAFSAAEACDAAADGIAAIAPEVETVTCPIADGGEGTAEAVCDALGGGWQPVRVGDPLGRPVDVRFAVVEDPGTGPVAVMEMSAASGLWRCKSTERDPWRASTAGTGEMIAAAALSGVQKILIGIGGSATNDGGTGMARVLGWRFLDRNGREITQLPENLSSLARVDGARRVPLPGVVAACDVTNPLLGDRGATAVYGAQKGVSPDAIARHEDRLQHLADVAAHDLGKDVRDRPGAGAAGGLGFGLMTFCDADLVPGFELVAGTVGLEAKMRTCDLVLTGEGKLDVQTGEGKGPAGVAEMARRLGRRVFAMGGIVDESEGGKEILHALFDEVVEICPPGWTADASIDAGPRLLREEIEANEQLRTALSAL